MRLTASILPRLAVPGPGLVLEQVPVLAPVLELAQALVLERHIRPPTGRPT